MITILLLMTKLLSNGGSRHSATRRLAFWPARARQRVWLRRTGGFVTRKNIVLILPDQLRPDFLGCYGADWLQTPAIDALASSSVRYTAAVSSAPLCVPARNALLTGMHPLRTGVLANDQGLRPDYRQMGIETWADRLSSAGYVTASIGKMHFYPWDAGYGFHHRVIAEDKRHIAIRDDYDAYLRRHGLAKTHANTWPEYHESRGATPPPVPWEHSVDHFVGTAAQEFIASRTGCDEPFAMMVGFPGPHCPYDPVPEFLDRVDRDRVPIARPGSADHAPERVQAARDSYLRAWADLDLSEFPDEARAQVRAHYSALVMQVDHEVGRVLQAIDEAGLAEDTIVILASDHGDFLGDRELLGKAMFHEESVRVPMMIRIPGHVPGINNAMVDLYDLAPTMLELVGAGVPEQMDARAVPGLSGLEAESRERVVGAVADGWMLREGGMVLHKYGTGEVLLYDHDADPEQIRDLSRDPAHRADLDRMDATLTREVMALVASGHEDKIGSSTEPEFYARGWQRPYPYPVKSFVRPESARAAARSDATRARDVSTSGASTPSATSLSSA
ncbi:sulfatase-like hydrolase/transferase [Ruania alkalisoli]|uniref:Sulfatase-like hydrolase/transferase n=1 Tax=Ruania alkalisoli TaxID=2779775 RepID=A0A7M1SU97_9MICO|nr:sulfatase-like hydrolase/transferase [Ruania alkalisoli]QOR70342.1 sulfatase-like hydrolase/transferase [Ruania alkalisoli]